MSFLEIACFNPQSVRIAATSGADRIELCTNASAGGLTPSLSEFNSLKSDSSSPAISIPIYVMIRPHDHSFAYTPSEVIQMKEDIISFLQAGADGFVFGALSRRNETVDEENCKILLAAAAGKPCTFHRAFDEIPEEDMLQELEKLIRLGFKNVLTSGGKRAAVEGVEVLNRLAERAGARLNVIVGGGVRSGNLEELRRGIGTDVRWWHSSAVVDVSKDGNGKGGVASKEEIENLGRLIRS